MSLFDKHPLPWEIVQASSVAPPCSAWVIQDATFEFVCGCDSEEMAQFIVEACMLGQGGGADEDD